MHLSASITLHSYRYDNRDGSHSHWSDDTILRGRASFEIAATGKAKLTIDNVQYDDHSVYKCRVDFKMAPTSISSITLKVIGKGFRFLFVMLKKPKKICCFYFLVPPAIPTIFLERKRHNSIADNNGIIQKQDMSLGIQDNFTAGE